MEETELQNELASIRSIMERSSKFISLSGLSGILAGIYALVGAGIVYYFHPWMINSDSLASYPTDSSVGSVWVRVEPEFVVNLFLMAMVILVASVVTAFLLSRRQAKRKNQPMWGAVSRQMMFHLTVPLVTGGILIIILLVRHHYGIIAPISLICYGLALFGASNFTFADVKYLGICEIILGLIAACLPGNGLLFWALGFGVLHIIYGARIYFKYDK